MKHPFARRVSDQEIEIRYPGVEARNLFELFAPDTLASLARRILLSEANPNDRVLFVPNSEVARVMALHPGQTVPAPVLRRLGQIGAEAAPRPKGRIRSHQGPFGDLFGDLEEERACDFYHCTHRRLCALKQAGRLDAWRSKHAMDDECNTPAKAAAEHTRRLFYPTLSRRTVENRISSRK